MAHKSKIQLKFTKHILRSSTYACIYINFIIKKHEQLLIFQNIIFLLLIITKQIFLMRTGIHFYRNIIRHLPRKGNEKNYKQNGIV